MTQNQPQNGDQLEAQLGVEWLKGQASKFGAVIRRSPRGMITGIGVAVLLACLAFGGVMGFNAVMIATLGVAGLFILVIKLAKYSPKSYDLLFAGKASGLKRLVWDVMAFTAILFVAGKSVTGLVAAGIVTLLVSVALEWLPRSSCELVSC